jgi:kinesin family protein C2/C3
LITQTWSSLGPNGKPLMLYKIAFDNGKEQQVDLSDKDARLVTAHVADTPRARGRIPYSEPRGTADGPIFGVANIPSPTKLADLKVPELRRICSDLGLDGKGAKKDLVEQLMRAHSTAQALLSGQALTPAVAEGESEELRSLHALVATLRAEAAQAMAAERALLAALHAKDAQLDASQAQLSAAEDRELMLQAELQELKGNVRVVVRLRPLKNPSEIPVAEPCGLMSSGMTRALTVRAASGLKTFEFDRVFGASATSDDVFEELRPLASAVADGSRATVLAYGQTGSGKTYTMNGLQRLAVQHLLAGLAKSAHRRATVLRLAIIEVYNEKVILRRGVSPSLPSHPCI